MLLFSIFYLMSILVTIGCSDWFLVWVGLEVNMMSFIALIYARSASSVEASMKYFIIQSMGSSVLMLVFFSNFLYFDFIMLMVLSYKIGGGPFFFWFPSMCDGIGWGSCFMLMSVQKILPVILSAFLVNMMLWVIILSSMIVGMMGSFNQSSTKQFMAYSSIHQIGWILLGNLISPIVSLVYLSVYSLMISGVVISFWEDKVLELGDMKMNTIKWGFVVGMLSMGGMPPMLGFFLKWWLFYSLMEVNYVFLLVMIITSVVMFYLYLRVVYLVLMMSKFIVSWAKLSSGKKSWLLLSGEIVYIMGVVSGPMMFLGL